MSCVFLTSSLGRRLLIGLFLIIYFSSLEDSLAQAPRLNPVLKCLGQEEKSLHEAKTNGPLYYLNQVFIEKMSGAGNLEIEPNQLYKICTDKQLAPSVALLRTLLTEGKQIFLIPKGAAYAKIASGNLATIEELEKELPHIFISYLGKIQNSLPTADCLVKHIPEIDEFHQKIKHLEEDLSVEEILSPKEKIHKIFEKLKSLDSIYKQCEEDRKLKKSKEENKVPTAP